VNSEWCIQAANAEALRRPRHPPCGRPQARQGLRKPGPMRGRDLCNNSPKAIFPPLKTSSKKSTRNSCTDFAPSNAESWVGVFPEGDFPAPQNDSKISTRNSCTDFTASNWHPSNRVPKSHVARENHVRRIVQKPRGHQRGQFHLSMILAVNRSEPARTDHGHRSPLPLTRARRAVRVNVEGAQLCGKYTRSMNGAFNTEDRQGLRPQAAVKSTFAAANGQKRICAN
jgi:hypothetical protein